MPAVISRLDGHRRAAVKRLPHAPNSAPEFIQRNNGMVPHDWQIDMAEALLLGLDCSLIAGTGAGKTMPFIMPLFVESEKIIIIISPLNALEVDQIFTGLALDVIDGGGVVIMGTVGASFLSRIHPGAALVISTVPRLPPSMLHRQIAVEERTRIVREQEVEALRL
ncbi:hypothetical protein B0H14DRAFT_3758269 [Mycena olivaceomarginata]|nr:hypothetical protein B0H14DRAFT_3758269 [Mycena olivaceomarginata]